MNLFEATVHEVAEGGRLSLDQHLEVEDLLPYLAGEASDEEADRLRDHLALCPSCCGLLLSAATFLETNLEDGALDPVEQAAAWKQLQIRIAAEKAASTNASNRRFASPRVALALAASLMLACVGLYYHGVSLQHRLEELSAPRGSVVLVDLLPEGERVRGEGPGEVRVPKSANQVVIILHLLQSRRFPSYRVVFTAGPRILWNTAALESSEDGALLLALSGRWLSTLEGRLRIELYGQSGGQDVPVASYSARIE